MKYLFQVCPKAILIHRNCILLCKRQGEQDFDGYWSLPGGKLERSDLSIRDGLLRELNEELGPTLRVELDMSRSYLTVFVKSSGTPMVLPHYAGHVLGGTIKLNHEYSEFKWVTARSLRTQGLVIPTIVDAVEALTPDWYYDTTLRAA